ncbi:hypothetical protein B296_00050196, partial [Ensete ventricosum]
GGGAPGGFGEHEGAHDDPDLSSSAGDGLSDEVIQKITKQVCGFLNISVILIYVNLVDKILKILHAFVEYETVEDAEKAVSMIGSIFHRFSTFSKPQSYTYILLLSCRLRNSTMKRIGEVDSELECSLNFW